MHISNFRPVKRVTDCVRILAEVLKATPAHLYMVGDGPDRPEAHRLARELGVERQVTFLGKQDHVERLFPQMHVLLMPSEMESFGLGALEGDGVRSTAGGHARGRIAGAGDGRRGRVSGAGGRYRRAVAPRDRAADE